MVMISPVAQAWRTRATNNMFWKVPLSFDVCIDSGLDKYQYAEVLIGIKGECHVDTGLLGQSCA